jgi:signal transduction histidine kinase
MSQNLKENILFPTLSDLEIEHFKEHGKEIDLKPGDTIFEQGDPTFHFYIVLEGEIQIVKTVGTEKKLLAVHDRGGFTGNLDTITGRPAIATGVSLGESRVLEIEPRTFQRIIVECPEKADMFLSAMAARSQALETQMLQQEKLAALGRLSAGLAHELNNPAAAARRAAQQLQEMLETLQTQMLKICEESLSKEKQQALLDLRQEALTHLSEHSDLDPLTRSDREDAVMDWLEEKGIDNAWQLAPTLVSAGLDEERLQPIAMQLNSTILEQALGWLENSLTVANLINTVDRSTCRMSELVKAVKAYSYMDRSPLQEVDVREGLENTLTILNHRLKKGVEVIKEYAPNLPKIFAYGSELNQVWTNLIDNAVDAVQGKGHLWIKTAVSGDFILVEIADNGAGIPLEIQDRIFEPFFTTKGVNQGSGLGLDIVRKIVTQRHNGKISVTSKPGDTKFQVCLPILVHSSSDSSRGDPR